MIIGALVLLCIPLGLLFKPIKDNKSHQSTETCEETTGRDKGTNWAGHLDLLYDYKFILVILSTLLANIGITIPYAFTVVSTKQRTPFEHKSVFSTCKSFLGPRHNFLSTLQIV